MNPYEHAVLTVVAVVWGLPAAVLLAGATARYRARRRPYRARARR